ncbi:MAG: tetratricopeptide repeat protein [Acidobacteriaceae bacterium]|nr:tetratricopeptide repeat protein [Acidobacteriaceae bacterium]
MNKGSLSRPTVLSPANPNSSDVLAERAMALLAQGQASAAADTLRRAITVRPAWVECFHKLGLLEFQFGRVGEALLLLRRAAIIEPNRAGIHADLGVILHLAGSLQDGLWHQRQAVILDPVPAMAYRNLARSLLIADRPAEALQVLAHAVRLDPGAPEIRNNIGNALKMLGRSAARDQYWAALILHPAFAEAHNNLGALERDQGAAAVAVTLCDRALTVMPDYAEARLNRGLARLTLGDLRAGWADYEARWRVPGWPSPPPPFHQPRWDGLPLAGRTLLLQAEQGLGDTLQFIRYAPRLAASDGRIALSVQAPLIPLLTNLPGCDVVVDMAGALPPFDCWLPLLSLPLVTGYVPEPAHIPYLTIAPERTAFWRRRLGPGPSVGLVWAGNPGNRNDRRRSCPLSRLEPLLAVAGVQWVSVQKGAAAADIAGLGWLDRMIDLDPEIRDFQDTGAILQTLDLLITVDTAVAHLGGALGRPTWIMLGDASDWRWQQDRRDSSWYPTARLFRQPTRGDWDSLVTELVAELRSLVTGFR